VVKLEDIKRGLQLQGIIPNQIVTVVDVSRGQDAIEIIYKRADGKPDSQLLYRQDEKRLAIALPEKYWHPDAQHALLRTISEAYRIHLAHLFDPRLAVHTSLIEPLPHQITAVYGEMLSRQPLRFLLADDPGAGKTIMAGLLIKELIVRGDVRRCLICAPGSLTEQWQDELWNKFKIRFEILTRDKVEASYSGNPFHDDDLLIVRLDQVSRDEILKDKLSITDWDLIICDEAHKMSAAFFGNEVKETKRYKLGKVLSQITRHFVLMTATPHNGHEEDFHLFMALLDADRFEGRGNGQEADTSDMMRRMVKEDLLKFDGRPLFPERIAYTMDYELSPDENTLYLAVTDYVREEFNRADRLQSGGRRGTVGFALTILQRRLASSPEAIYQSLNRRRKRLEKKLKDAQQNKQTVETLNNNNLPDIDEEYLDDNDDFPDAEFEELEIELVDSATAAQTIVELEAEIQTLSGLERQASQLRRTGTDRKWEELAELMQSDMMFNQSGSRRKIVIFTEHRDTLGYLKHRLTTLLGNDEGIVTIHGGIRRSDRLETENRFRNDPQVYVLLATDAAGEGINLQRAHLMVNYDLPWNPNRLEQRFGRIHRIGQEEVCHLWNLVSSQTREGHVYRRLLQKLEVERHALGGKVFDVLGRLFRDESLRSLLVEAIRYGDRPDVRARLDEAVDNATDRERVRELLEEHALVQQVMDTSQIERIRDEMERAAARRLQPFYIKSFFLDAFALLGGTIFDREPGRYQINHVPAVIRDRAKEIRGRGNIQQKYERICFEKTDINLIGKPQAEFIFPGHLFLDTLIDLISQRYSKVLQDGVILLDPNDTSKELRALYFVEHSLRDASKDERIISREVRFVEVDNSGKIHSAGYAPYLDYRPLSEKEMKQLIAKTDLQVLGEETAAIARQFAIDELAAVHREDVRKRREALIDRTLAAVQSRLSREINIWERRAIQLKDDEREGKRNAKINWQKAMQRADELYERLNNRKRELEEQRQISAMPPVLVGRALIVPMGLLLDVLPPEMQDKKLVEQIAMRAVMEAEMSLGNNPRDVSIENKGYDIESRDARTGRLRFLEVKGRRADAPTITVSHNEIVTGLNMGEQFALVIVEVENRSSKAPRYVWKPPFVQPNSITVNVSFSLKELLNLSTEPG
jgi:SNF2 family DNA or RNA helicase